MTTAHTQTPWELDKGVPSIINGPDTPHIDPACVHANIVAHTDAAGNLTALAREARDVLKGGQP